jgi:hypothetical protein
MECAPSNLAVDGEACGGVMDLAMLGSGSDKALREMMQYIQETQHKKVIRVSRLGLPSCSTINCCPTRSVLLNLDPNYELTGDLGSPTEIWRCLHYRTSLRRRCR